jgi:hypothetical protein
MEAEPVKRDPERSGSLARNYREQGDRTNERGLGAY